MNASDLLGGYSEAELSAAFAKVAPAGNWKMPIFAFLPGTTSAEKLKLTGFAITFYTGSVATFTETPVGIWVNAPGYYAAVGA